MFYAFLTNLKVRSIFRVCLCLFFALDSNVTHLRTFRCPRVFSCILRSCRRRGRFSPGFLDFTWSIPKIMCRKRIIICSVEFKIEEGNGGYFDFEHFFLALHPSFVQKAIGSLLVCIFLLPAFFVFSKFNVYSMHEFLLDAVQSTWRCVFTVFMVNF